MFASPFTIAGQRSLPMPCGSVTMISLGMRPRQLCWQCIAPSRITTRSYWDLAASDHAKGDHKMAVPDLKRACSGARIDSQVSNQGIEQLKKLLGAKTDISYGDKHVDDEWIAALCIAAERFQVWAERIMQRQRGRG